MRTLAMLLTTLVLWGCENPKPSSPTVPSVEMGTLAFTAPPPPPKPDPMMVALQLVRATSTLQSALFVAKRWMQDRFDDDSDGTIMMALWAMDKMAWSDTQPGEVTNYRLVMKDRDAELGKTLCTRGTIVQISRSDPALYTSDVYDGLLSNNGDLYRFFAVGTTGDLVNMSTATFCGVVTGRYDYSNSVGGAGHAVSLVGMFRLRPNLSR